MKKILSTIFCLSFVVLLYSCVVAAPQSDLVWDEKPATLADIAKNTNNSFIDVEGNYNPLYYDYAFDLWNNGLFLGSEGSFNLNEPLTRAEGIVVTIRILGKEAEAKESTADITFTDVPDWAKPYVAYAVGNGISNGYSSTLFGSSDHMTAAQFITLTLRAMGFKDGDDFMWDTSYDKALEIGLIQRASHTQYVHSNLFMRDDVALIAHNAIFEVPIKTGGKLSDTIRMPGKPSGATPSAVRVIKLEKNSPARIESSSNNVFLYGRSFSDEVAWVQSKDLIWQCIDKKGEIIFKLDEGDFPSYDFSKGVAVVRRAGGTSELINKNGEVVSSPQIGDYDRINMFLPDLGMTRVSKTVNTLQYTGDLYGLIDNNGNWEIPLHEEDWQLHKNGFDPEYIGEGYLQSYDFLYNVFTSSLTTVSTLPSRTWGTVSHFENGYGVARYFVFSASQVIDSYGVCSISSEGTLKTIFNDYPGNKALIGQYREELFYFSDKGNNGTRQGFFDINGNLVIDLYDYDAAIGGGYTEDTPLRKDISGPIVAFKVPPPGQVGVKDPAPCFSEGYCTLYLTNKQGGRFVTIIDKNRKMVFEPISSIDLSISNVRCGLFIESGKFGTRIKNTSNEIIAEFTANTIVSLYKNDVACVGVYNDSGSMIEFYYIDKLGKRLF